ncbi:MAG: sodium/solute symporter [Salinivirgaceae bacterium]|nr:sodium/solute symporter [Salinivirgaceae bacterium]MBR3566751.1 sodium/solute symporter [Salinivirgaceae bacterium]
MRQILDSLANNGFAVADYAVFIVYILILVGCGVFIPKWMAKKKGANGAENSKDYFLAGNSLTWWAVGASLIAANISAEQFIGMSGSAYASGIAIAAYELMAAATLLVVAKFLLPVMIRKNIFTIPQFLSDRYNWGVGLAFSSFWLFLYVFINLTSVAWLGALAIKQILGLPTIVGMFGMDMTLVGIILILYLIAGAYSIYGGLASVAWTDVMQVTFLVGGGLITAYFTLDFIAPLLGADGAVSALGAVMDKLGTIEGDKHFNLVVDRNSALYPNITDDPYFTLPGLALIIGALWLTNIGYWGFNQYIIQKGLAAKSLDEAKKGLLFAAFLKILIPFIVCIPGVCAFLIWQHPDLLSGSIDLHGTIERSDDAYPFLIRNFTPVVVKGLSFAALTAAVISSLASMFNSTSTIFTMDVYKKFINKEASERKLVSVGRITSIVALLLALVAVYPIMGGADQAFQIIQEYSGFVYPGVVVIFGLGLLWKRSSGPAAVVAAIGTFFFSILFKFIMPETPFLLRMGYVFMVLVVLFIGISIFCNKKNEVAAAEMDGQTVEMQRTWSNILLGVGAICLILGIVQLIAKIEFLQIYGFEAIFFLAAMLLTLGFYLRSNANDSVQDHKAVGTDLELFHTDKVFNIGALAVIAILAVLYIALW